MDTKHIEQCTCFLWHERLQKDTDYPNTFCTVIHRPLAAFSVYLRLDTFRSPSKLGLFPWLVDLYVFIGLRRQLLFKLME